MVTIRGARSRQNSRNLNSEGGPKTPIVHGVNTPHLCGATALLIITACFVQPLNARVGESQGDVERRILQPNLGKHFFRAKDKDNRDNDRQQQREERDQPFFAAKEFFPPDIVEKTYWKSALANQLSNDNGWRVHVFYAGGRSMLEAYRRVGESLNEFEVRALLLANRGASSWRKMSSEGGGTNGIGYDFELEDGSMRARQQGNWLMIFSTRFDNYVVEQQKIAKEKRDKELAIQKVE
ncbi:MAG: hypothetical protein ABW223_07670, partial [Rariglobus sp.]